jgi:hypothetical protein
MIPALRTSWIRRVSVAYLLMAVLLPSEYGMHAITTVPPYHSFGPFPITGQQVAPPPELPDRVSSGGGTITAYLSELFPDSSDESVFLWSIRDLRIEAVQFTGVDIQGPPPPGVSADERRVDIWNGPGDPRPLAEALQPDRADPGNWVVITNQQRQQLLADLWYLNVRSSGNVDADPETKYPAWLEGELQGQLLASIYVIPVPSALALGGIGIALVQGLRRRASLA